MVAKPDDEKLLPQALALVLLTFVLHAGALGAFFVGDDFDFLDLSRWEPSDNFGFTDNTTTFFASQVFVQ